MSKAKQLAFLLVFQTIGFLFFLLSITMKDEEFLITLFPDDLDEDSAVYINTVQGFLAVLFLLIPIMARLGKAKKAGLVPLPFYWFAACISIATNAIVFVLTIEDLLVGSLLLLVTITTWSYALYLDPWVRANFNKIIAWTSRGCTTFLIIFMPAFWFYIPIRTYSIGLNPLTDTVFDILVGVAMMSLLVFSWLVSRYRIAGITSAIMYLYWYVEISQWMLRNWDRLLILHEGTWVFVVILTMALAVNAGMTLGKLLGETAVLANSRRSSGLLGPWFSTFRDGRWTMKDQRVHKKKIKRGIKIGLVLVACAVPGMLPVLNLTPVPVTIRPRTDYTMRFSFWASPDLNGSYNASVRQELDDHHANLDITTSISPSSIQTLIDFETAMPNITYRTTISASPYFDQMYETIVYQTELIIPKILDGNITQWKGFAFDIEGEPYMWWQGFDTVDDAVAEWNQTFDYIYNNASAQVGFQIDMENVGSHLFDAEMLFDGDMDMQLIEGYVNNNPPNFTTHAPMVYRCMVDDCFTPESIWTPWMTSYSIYNALYTLNGTVGEDKLGIYLGITNCCCYSMDLPQTESYTWPEGENTGFTNLIRDTLIAKHFGVKEVTYFLQFSTPFEVNGTPYFGAFESYGDNFLDVLNDSVNTNPPEEFIIYYNYDDAIVTRHFYRDVLGDISRPLGVGLVIAAAASSVFVVILSEIYRKRKDGKDRETK